MTGPPGADGIGPGGPPPRIRPYLNPSSGPPARDADGGADRADPNGPFMAPTGLRPYVITSGRVAANDPSLGLEAQVSAVRGGPTSNLSPERAAIVALCATPLSVAEIAARLRLHLGVTRILVGDLRAAGLLHVNTVDTTRPHSPETILRVMRGLRAIS